jgi:hypothetical protein
VLQIKARAKRPPIRSSATTYLRYLIVAAIMFIDGDTDDEAPE